MTYTYDKGGNRITQLRQNAAASNLPTAVVAANIAYDAANELTRWNSATTNLTYNSNGNLATETQGGLTTTYTWDARNRLSGISRTGLTASFAYDALGRRKSKTINGATTGFWYDGNDVYAEIMGATPSATYIRGLSIDEPYIRKGANDEFYETDALGTSIALTNAAGASQTTYTYQPYGVSTQLDTPSSNAFQYTGRDNDETGLIYYRARYYHPNMQRFVTEDPLRFRGGENNFYVYTNNSPTQASDPLGLFMIDSATCRNKDTRGFIRSMAAVAYDTAMNKPNCLNCSQRQAFKARWEDLVISCWPSNYTPNGRPACGFQNDSLGTNVIWLTPQGLNAQGCWSVPGTIFHETLHTLTSMLGPEYAGEQIVRELEANCFTRPPTMK